MGRFRGDYEYTGKTCDQCKDAAVVQVKFEGNLCQYHLEDAYLMEEADRMAKWIKEQL